MLAGQEECLEFDPTLFTTFVEKVVISGTKKDVMLRFVLRNRNEFGISGLYWRYDHFDGQCVPCAESRRAIMRMIRPTIPKRAIMASIA